MKIPVHASSVWRARAIVLPGASVWCFSSRFSFSSLPPPFFVFFTVCKTFCIQVTHFHVPQSAAGFDVLSPCIQFWNWNCFVVDVQCSSCMCSHVVMESPSPCPMSCNVPVLTLRLSTNAAGNGEKAATPTASCNRFCFACISRAFCMRFCSTTSAAIVVAVVLAFFNFNMHYFTFFPRFRLSSTLSLRWNSMRN